MFYKKMIYSAPNVWPIILIIASFILIAIIARLSVLLDMPKVRENTIPIGFQNIADLSALPDINDCGYIDIRKAAKVKSHSRKSHFSWAFHKDSFVCAKGSYRDQLKNKRKLQSMGAVETDGDHAINGYITNNIFHSAPMTLNLLHNIIIKYIVFTLYIYILLVH